MQFHTESGSIYEVDTDHKRIRRVSNSERPATLRQGNNAWKDYSSLSDIVVGSPVLISWEPKNTPLLPESPSCALPATLTSAVTKIVQSEAPTNAKS